MRKAVVTFGLTILFIGVIYGQCDIVSDVSGTLFNSDSSSSVNYTTEVSGGSEFYFASAFTACDIEYPQINTAWTGNAPEAGTIIYTFDQPILAVRVVLAGVGLNGQALQESFTFTTNNEDPVISVDPGSCADWIVDANTVTSPDVIDGLNGIALVYSKTGFTTLTITSSEGNDTNGGSFIGFCATSMIPAPIVHIQDNAWGDTVKLFPNPSSGALTLTLDRPAADMQIDIVNLLGSSVYTLNTNGRQTIDMDLNLAPGPYVLRIQDNAETWSSKLIMK